MIHTAKTRETLIFRITPPIYHPYCNRSRENAYYTYAPFDHDPFCIWAHSTSGSPVVLGTDCFFGFMNENADGRFAYDGLGNLSVTLGEGQSLYIEENCNPYDAWAKYSAAVRSGHEKHTDEDFWSDIEYCTWVDQKAEALELRSDPNSVLCEDFVYRYLERIKKLELPAGKLTIDDGWDLRFPEGARVIGNWEIDRKKFPHFEKLISDIRDAGFMPGLWFCPFNITPNSKLASAYPALVGENWDPNATETLPDSLTFISPRPELLGVLEDYYRSVFGKYITIGIKKFKLDMSYASKRDMKELLSLMYRVIKSIDPSVEVEAHIPDIFLSRYCDTVRLNDVDLDAEGKWREVTYEHYKVCRLSSPDRILNFDHIGANTPDPDPLAFMEHAKLILSLKGGYPCVSYLPDRFEDKRISDEFVSLIKRWEK